jgi:hypothetical protein
MMLRRTLQLAAAFGMMATAAGVCAQLPLKRSKPAVEDLSWMWQYTKPSSHSSGALTGDPRFSEFVTKNFTAPQSFWDKDKPLPETVEDFLALPGAIVAEENRYLSVDGCVAHFCPDRGMMWIDLGVAHPLAVFAAIDWISENRPTDQVGSAYTMWVFSNRTLSPDHIPAPLTRSIARWTGHPSSGATDLQNITRVFFVDPDGTPHPVTPNTIGAHNSLPPETTTEPQQASTNIKALP